MTRYLTDLARRSLTTFAELLQIMLPVMILVRLGNTFGLSEALAWLLAPVMGLAGLPPETGIVWATALLTGVYGGIGAYLVLLPDLGMTVAQHSILCAMILFAHALPVEQAIVRRAGASFLLTSLLRVGAALTYGATVAWICAATGALSEPLEPILLGGGAADAGWGAWAVETAVSLASILVIVALLFALLDGLKALGVLRWTTRLLEPLLRGIGLDPRMAPMTTIGMLLGLTYGGALIIQATKDQQFDARARFLALACLSLSHALIEDTALMLALGADVWIVLVGRLAFTLAIVAALAALLKRWPVSTGRLRKRAREDSRGLR